MRTVLYRFLQTSAAWTPLVARLTLAIGFFPHRAQKVLGWFDGMGLNGAFNYFGSMGIPPVLAVLAIAAEFLGSSALFVGLGARLAALALAVRAFIVKA